MNWAKDNKFLATFLGVMVVVVGVLGFLLFSAKSNYEATQTAYEDMAGQWTRLNKTAPFPSAENVEKMQEQRKAHQAEIEQLQKALAANEIPLEELSAVQFQDRLRESVTKVTTEAQAAGLMLPEKFYLAFDRYQTEPPPQGSAPRLGRQLKAIQLVMEKLIAETRGAGARSGILNELARVEVPEETGKPVVEKKPAGRDGDRGAAATKKESDLLRRDTFALTFTADQEVFRNVLNYIVSAPEQFFIIRRISIKNEKLDGPAVPTSSLPGGGLPPGLAPPEPAPEPAQPTPAAPAPDGATPPAANPAAAPAPGAPTADPSKLEFIVGNEKLQVTLVIDIIDFQEPAEPKTPKAAAN